MEYHAKPQVAGERHYRRNYMTLLRAITIWHQADKVASCLGDTGGTVLEIGPGAGLSSWFLRSWGYSVFTFDIDASIRPMVVADVRSLPVIDSTFDCVMAAEVLEHLPFDQFQPALREIARVTRRFALVTLPAPFAGIAALFNFPFLRPFGLRAGLPYRVRHKFDGQHYWELGKTGYSLRRVLQEIEACGFSVKESYCPPPSKYSWFFLLEKNR